MNDQTSRRPTRPGRNANASSPKAQLPRTRPDLGSLESVVRRYQKASLEAGRALRTVRDEKLYLLHTAYKTFEDYVENTYDFSIRNAQYLIGFADDVDTFVTAGTVAPVMTIQSRALRRIPEDDRVQTWAQLVKEHGLPSKVTAAMILACLPGGTEGPDAEAPVVAPPAPPGPRVPSSPSVAERPEPTDDELVVGESAAVQTAARQQNADLSTATWPNDALRALRQVAKAHRDAVIAEVNAFAAEVEGEEVEAWMVEDTADGYGAAILEDGLDASPEDAGWFDTAPEVQGDGTADAPILDLAILPEPGLAHPPKFKRGTLFLGTGEKTPLLVSLPRAVVPAAITADLRPDAQNVVVEIGELERRGGPVRNGVLDLAEVRAAALAVGVVTLIQTTNENVDWARRTINPVTGCQHACRVTFCYAAGIARRLFAQGFIPTLHPCRLDAFGNTRLPKTDGLTDYDAWVERSVFVVSMGDLFGKWIPRWYRQAVLDEIGMHQGWFCFLLTKDPGELAGLNFPPNCAVGLTITGDEDTTREAQERRYRKYAEALAVVEGAAFTWLSAEPFRGEIHDLQPFADAGVRLIALGGQSRTVLAPAKGEKLIVVPARQPDIRWVESVRQQADRFGIERFEKANLTVRRRDIPWPAGLPGV